MMISPMTYEELHEKDTYEELINERNYLIKELKKFENNKNSEIELKINPSPEVIYQMNLKYLSCLCSLMQEKFKEGQCAG